MEAGTNHFNLEGASLAAVSYGGLRDRFWHGICNSQHCEIKNVLGLLITEKKITRICHIGMQ